MTTENSVETRRVEYVIGHDQVSQTLYDAANPLGITHTFTTDGHGSTRALLDAAETIAELYHYDAYGNLLGGVDPATTLTNILCDFSITPWFLVRSGSPSCRRG